MHGRINLLAKICLGIGLITIVITLGIVAGFATLEIIYYGAVKRIVANSETGQFIISSLQRALNYIGIMAAIVIPAYLIIDKFLKTFSRDSLNESGVYFKE